MRASRKGRSVPEQLLKRSWTRVTDRRGPVRSAGRCSDVMGGDTDVSSSEFHRHSEATAWRIQLR
jgi:hypothetical protein